MSDGTDTAAKQARSRRGVAPPEMVAIVGPALNFGLLAGSAGIATGIVSGLRRDLSPGILGVARGAQWFVMGTSYWTARAMVLKAWGDEHSPTPTNKIAASSVGGATTGALAGLLRGPRNIIPGAIVFTGFGALGQLFVNYVQGRAWSQKESKSILESEWSPLRKISNEEYKGLMDEKILRLDAEIALIDDKIAELRAASEKNPERTSQDIGAVNDKGKGQ